MKAVMSLPVPCAWPRGQPPSGPFWKMATRSTHVYTLKTVCHMKRWLIISLHHRCLRKLGDRSWGASTSGPTNCSPWAELMPVFVNKVFWGTGHSPFTLTQPVPACTRQGQSWGVATPPARPSKPKIIARTLYGTILLTPGQRFSSFLVKHRGISFTF